MLNYLILPQEIGFLPALMIPDTTQYFIVAFHAVKSFVISHYAHTCRKKELYIEYECFQLHVISC